MYIMFWHFLATIDINGLLKTLWNEDTFFCIFTKGFFSGLVILNFNKETTSWDFSYPWKVSLDSVMHWFPCIGYMLHCLGLISVLFCNYKCDYHNKTCRFLVEKLFKTVGFLPFCKVPHAQKDLSKSRGSYLSK